MRVVVAYSPAPRQVCEETLDLPENATVLVAARAISERAESLFRHLNDIESGRAHLGVWGKVVLPTDVLKDGDRLEFYRPLLADPKTARRERFLKQGKRGAGLFAKRRPGGKAGY